MIKLPKQQEKFAQSIFKGNNQTDAYNDAYPTSKKWKKNSVYSNASQLMENTKVIQRLKELRTPIIEKLEYTAEKSYLKLEELQALALMPDGINGKLDLSNALKAEDLKQKLFGLQQRNLKIDANINTKTVFVCKEDMKEVHDMIINEIEE